MTIAYCSSWKLLYCDVIRSWGRFYHFSTGSLPPSSLGLISWWNLFYGSTLAGASEPLVGERWWIWTQPNACLNDPDYLYNYLTECSSSTLSLERTVPEFIDPCSFHEKQAQNALFRLVFAKTGSINSGTGLFEHIESVTCVMISWLRGDGRSPRRIAGSMNGWGEWVLLSPWKILPLKCWQPLLVDCWLDGWLSSGW